MQIAENITQEKTEEKGHKRMKMKQTNKDWRQRREQVAD